LAAHAGMMLAQMRENRIPKLPIVILHGDANASTLMEGSKSIDQ
jgi:hypothetical protein